MVGNTGRAVERGARLSDSVYGEVNGGGVDMFSVRQKREIADAVQAEG